MTLLQYVSNLQEIGNTLVGLSTCDVYPAVHQASSPNGGPLSEPERQYVMDWRESCLRGDHA